MSFETDDMNGLVLGAWGAVQATAAGLAIALGGLIRDLISSLAQSGILGSALDSSATGYSFVYHIEFYLLFATLVVLGPLVAYRPPKTTVESAVEKKFGLAELPG
jgi:BCD family chlorophyll transporter-like MFS transporter